MLRIQDCETELAWCAVQCVSGKEALLSSEIARNGLSVYWPRFQDVVRTNGYSGRKRLVLRSLFPGYLFGGFGFGSSEWRRICSLPGQLRVLTSAPERPSLVPMSLLRSLLGHEGELAHNLRLARIAFGFKVGDTVRVTDGPFTGFYAKLTELDDDGRISLLIDFLGRQVPITSGMNAQQVGAA